MLKKKMKHLLYGTSTIIYSSVGLALFTEKGPFSTSVSLNMQICLRVIQVIFKRLYKCQEAEREILDLNKYIFEIQFYVNYFLGKLTRIKCHCIILIKNNPNFVLRLVLVTFLKLKKLKL